ncbi:MAG TPA: threonine/serine dehydratase [Steroidobacteraceae bacterium]|jgi:threonine dehydratase|nr:threonine/serine dehydratase [Steroidobacteraceae bacterium]
MPDPDVTLAAIERARERIADRVRCTPILHNETLDTLLGAHLSFKCECLQQTGAFKARGAVNAVFSLSDDRLRAGVVTHSSGNHGAAVAYAARLRGVPATVVMPTNSSAAKFDAVRDLGARILTCEPTLTAREARAAQFVAETGAAFVHPYDDPDVIAGQGTLALELLQQQPDLDWVLVPVGGGGLLSGVATAVKALRPQIRVIGVEPARADDAARSFRLGSLVPYQVPDTIADGLRGALSERTLAIIRQRVDEIVTVSEQGIVAAMRTLWERLKVTVEASSAVPFAALLEAPPAMREAICGRRVGIVLTGGNVDLKTLPWS